MQKISTSQQMGRILTARRKAVGLTQAHVAAQLGISQNRLSEIENLPGHLTLDRLLALAGILGLELTLQARENIAPSESEW